MGKNLTIKKTVLYATLVAYLVLMIAVSAINNTVTAEAAAPLSPEAQEFVEKYRGLARYYESTEGIDYRVTLTYSAHETLWGQSDAATDSRQNFFGMHNTEEKIATHGSVEHSYELFFQNLHTTPQYAEAHVFDHPDDPYAQLMAISGPYNTADPEYKTKITRIYEQICAYEERRIPEIQREQYGEYLRLMGVETQAELELKEQALVAIKEMASTTKASGIAGANAEVIKLASVAQKYYKN